MLKYVFAFLLIVLIGVDSFSQEQRGSSNKLANYDAVVMINGTWFLTGETRSKIVFFNDSTYQCYTDKSYEKDFILGRWSMMGSVVTISFNYESIQTSTKFDIVSISDSHMTILHNGIELSYIKEKKK
jgi:hypothetical protein